MKMLFVVGYVLAVVGWCTRNTRHRGFRGRKGVHVTMTDLAMAALIVLSPFIWGSFIWWGLAR